jgi:hypothetical protein
MAIKEKITEKEKSIKILMETIRVNLNSKSIEFKNNPNDWNYFASLSHTELKLKEIVEFFNS